MVGSKGAKMRAFKLLLRCGNWIFAPVGNLFIAILFKQAPNADQYAYVRSQSYGYKVL